MEETVKEHKHSALGGERAQEIRKLHAQGISQTELARRYGVSVSCINGIVKRTRYPHAESEASYRGEGEGV